MVLSSQSSERCSDYTKVFHVAPEKVCNPKEATQLWLVCRNGHICECLLAPLSMSNAITRNRHAQKLHFVATEIALCTIQHQLTSTQAGKHLAQQPEVLLKSF